jgi:uncharacterized protein
MNFEWDESKNQKNIEKHFFDFADAREVFSGPMLTVPDDRFDYDEVRFRGLGVLRNIVVVIAFTELNDDTIRVISLRRALKRERERFYEFLKNRLG